MLFPAESPAILNDSKGLIDLAGNLCEVWRNYFLFANFKQIIIYHNEQSNPNSALIFTAFTGDLVRAKKKTMQAKPEYVVPSLEVCIIIQVPSPYPTSFLFLALLSPSGLRSSDTGGGEAGTEVIGRGSGRAS